MTPSTRISIATRASLLQRLQQGVDEPGWHEFHERYRELIRSFALKAGLNEGEADEVVQDTFIGVARRLPEFRYQPEKCSFKTWLLNQTVWRVKDQFRKRLKGKAQRSMTAPDDGQTATVEKISDQSEQKLAAIWKWEWQQAVLTAALREVQRSVNLKDCQIFDLLVLRGIEPRCVAESLQVSLARVYLAKHRISKLVRREIAAIKDQF